LSDVIEALLSDDVLPGSNGDHPLSGDWLGYRECHVKPDLYTLRLARLGSRSELF
jgi:mRNA interferase YafQ